MRRSPSAPRLQLTPALAALAFVLGCDDTYKVDPGLEGYLPFTPDRPDRDAAAPPAPYDGDDPIVLEAQSRYATGLDLHVKAIRRTCSPTEGVCHYAKEYPDLHTAANWLAAIAAPCNIQSGTREGIYDRCERPGDRFELDTREVASGPLEIGRLDYIAGESEGFDEDHRPDAASPGLHLRLAEPLSTERSELWSSGRFIRTFVDAQGLIEDLVYATYTTRWFVLDGGRHLFGEVAEWQIDDVSHLLEVGVVEGDPNGNGVFGSREGDAVALLVPGDPETSYLVARIRGTMEGEAVPGTRMPLANQPLSNAEMLALYCFIEGLPASGAPERLDGPIDYKACSYSADPTNLDLYGSETRVTWSGRISRILETNCGGCHDADSPSGELPLTGPDAYGALLAPADIDPTFVRLAAGDLEASYLWLKLTNDEAIEGSPMPTSPVTGWRPLGTADLDAIRTWILDGAPRD